ncbi:hypothetical protein D1872_329760 [compost metagenome]
MTLVCRSTLVANQTWGGAQHLTLMFIEESAYSSTKASGAGFTRQNGCSSMKFFRASTAFWMSVL